MNQAHVSIERPPGAVAGQSGQDSWRRRVLIAGPPKREETAIHRGTEVEVPRGRILYREGDESSTPYLVVSGVLRVSVATASGRDRLADLVGSGDVVGTAAIDGAHHAETVVAADDAVVATIDLPATLARRAGRDALTAALVRQLTRSRALADDLGLPMGARICRILARLADRLGAPATAAHEGGTAAAPHADEPSWRHLPFPLTHDDVALLAGCARVTATRILGELKEAGVLDGRRGNYALVPAALIEAADRYVYDVL